MKATYFQGLGNACYIFHDDSKCPSPAKQVKFCSLS